MNIKSVLNDLGLSVESKFVPFSQSRNKGNEYPSLNWVVTVKKDGRDVLTTDYSAGCAHCPGYEVKEVPAGFKAPRFKSRNDSVPGGWKYRDATKREALSQYRDQLVAAECESGEEMRLSHWGTNSFEPIGGRPGSTNRRQKITPTVEDVFYSLVSDADALDYSGFEDWADNYGYDTDSRKAEAIYRACLNTALKLRSALGDGLEALREAFQDY